jgi:hypothetical protein
VALVAPGAQTTDLLQISVSTMESDFRTTRAFVRSPLLQGEGDDSGAL